MDYLGFTIWELSNEWQKQLTKALDKVNLTHVQFLILKSVYELEVNHEDTAQVKVAKQAKTNIMMTSKVIRTLVTKGYLERYQYSTDKRAFRLMLTKNGKSTLRKSLNIVQAFEQDFFSELEKKKKLNKELSKLTKKAKR